MIIGKEKYKDTYIVYIDESPERHQTRMGNGDIGFQCMHYHYRLLWDRDRETVCNDRLAY